MTNMPPPPINPSPDASNVSEVLADVIVEVRRDLEITRQLFSGQPLYIIRDEVSFQSRSLTALDYRIFSSLDGKRTCAENFNRLVSQGVLEASREEEYYAFLIALHQRGLLNLPISDGQRLYDKYQKRVAAARKGRWLQLLCYKLPLWNPDHWLTQNLSWLRMPFSRFFVLTWFISAIIAITLVIARWDEFVSPLASVLAMQNLPLLLLLLCVLKAWHELGHASACKLWGASVPEVGVLLIVGSPCAYVDASAAWGIPGKSRRILVTMAGIYFESIVAIISVAVWVFAESLTVRSVAHHIILLSTLTTLIFNAKPLMRFDGYYALSDLLETPNLRQRASQAVMAMVKWVCLGIHSAPQAKSWGDFAGLVLFGLASNLYRVMIVLGIVALLAFKLPVIGIAAGAIYVAAGCASGLFKLLGYLTKSPETKQLSVRVRAAALVACSACVAGIWIPVPFPTSIQGVVTQQFESVVRAPQSGFVRELLVAEGEQVQEGQPLVQLRDELLELSAERATSKLFVSRALYRASNIQDPVQAALRRSELANAIADASHMRRSVDQLVLRSPQSGKIVQFSLLQEQDRRVQAGEPLMRIASGTWQLRCVATQAELHRIAPQVNETIEISFPWDQQRRYPGRVYAVAPCGSPVINDLELTHVGGGSIPVNPVEQKADQPYFLITVDMDDLPPGAQRHGTRANVHFTPRRSSLWAVAQDRWTAFYQNFQQQEL